MPPPYSIARNVVLYFTQYSALKNRPAANKKA
jgi:hypothetical protein